MLQSRTPPLARKKAALQTSLPAWTDDDGAGWSSGAGDKGARVLGAEADAKANGSSADSKSMLTTASVSGITEAAAAGDVKREVNSCRRSKTTPSSRMIRQRTAGTQGRENQHSRGWKEGQDAPISNREDFVRRTDVKKILPAAMAERQQRKRYGQTRRLTFVTFDTESKVYAPLHHIDVPVDPESVQQLALLAFDPASQRFNGDRRSSEMEEDGPDDGRVGAFRIGSVVDEETPEGDGGKEGTNEEGSMVLSCCCPAWSMTVLPRKEDSFKRRTGGLGSRLWDGGSSLARSCHGTGGPWLDSTTLRGDVGEPDG